MKVLIAPSSVDQHANVSIEGFHNPEENLGFTVVRNPVHVLQPHLGQFLERPQSLPLQLVHPPLQVVEHGPSIVVVPQSLQAVFKQVGLQGPTVYLKQPMQLPAAFAPQILPSTLQQPPLPFDESPLLWP